MRYTRTPIALDDPFDLDAVKQHARIDGTHDDAALAMMARAAAREIEAHAELALLWQNITLELDRWDDAISLPIGPFSKAAALLYDVTIQTRADDGTLGELTAAVQTSVSLWEAGLSLADVTGTDLLTRRDMAIAARALALRGECLFLIRDRLIPCTDWDISTRYGLPRAYRVGLPEIGGGRNETVLAGEVLHFRIGCDAVTPWAGSAPLGRAKLSAQLLEAIETAMRDVFQDAPIGSQIVPVPEG